MRRRTIIAGLFGIIAATVLSRRAAAEASKTRLILLGTGGGPRPRKASSGSAQVIIVGASAYVVDCGDGVARQLAMADIPLATLKSIFITHHHSDHNADYGNLMLLAWASGLNQGIDTYGPPPLVKMTQLFFEMSASDIETRIADEKRPPLKPLVRPHELRKSGVVMQDENVKVTAALVNHPPVVPSFGYRFDTADRSIVISGDTTPVQSLIDLARDADVLVHDALFAPGVERLASRVPNAPALRQSILSHHTTAEDAGRVAREANVKTLVLSHLVPPDDPEITREQWISAARKNFDGEIVVGQDQLEI